MQRKALFKAAMICLFGLSLSVFNYSCQKDDNTTPSTETEQLEFDQYFVPLEFAKSYAINYRQNPTIFEDMRENKSLIKISSFLAFQEKGQVPTAYIFNFADGKGFMILAADLREEPILAYSGTSYFNLEEIPTGLASWAEAKHDVINQMRADESDMTKESSSLWEAVIAKACAPNCTNYPACLENIALSCEKEAIKDYQNRMCSQDDPLWPDCLMVPGGGDPGNGGCTPTTTIRGPHLATTWNQGCTYNSACPTVGQLGCTGGSCGRAWVGCVAIAMGQVMHYHQHPNTYTWSNMPNTTGSTTMAIFLRDVGDAVNMNYGCDGSGASMGKAKRELKNTFNYASSVDKISYSSGTYQTVKAELNASRPVIFSGFSTKNWLGIISDGHAWVCDGYKRVDNCTYGTLHFHMNWGWGGSFNGYYAYNKFNPSNFNFQYNQDIIKGIKP